MIVRPVSFRASCNRIEPTPPADFPLDDITQVVKAAAAHAPVIGVHVDSEDEAEVCYIGRLVSVDDDGFNMQEITPDETAKGVTAQVVAAMSFNSRGPTGGSGSAFASRASFSIAVPPSNGTRPASRW